MTLRKHTGWIRRLLIGAAVAIGCAAQVPVQLAPTPRLQFFTTNGTPCAGCSLYTYAAGSSTPQATYVDSSGTTPNSNPIILDSMGSASVWLADLSYKLVLVDTNAVQIFSVDNIKPNDNTYLRLDFANGPVTGNGEFSGAVSFTGGGSFMGTFTGAPAINGNWSFSGSPTFTGAPTFGKLTSLTTNPALSGFMRLAALDQICFRNTANTADDCLKQGSSDQWVFPTALQSPTANPAQSGKIQLASGDAINWRNAANSGDIGLSKDSSDNLLYNGNIVAQASGGGSPLRYSAVTPVTVSNATSATLQSVTTGSGVLNTAGRTFHIVAAFAIPNTSGGSLSADLTVSVGGVALVSGIAVGVTNLSTCSQTIYIDGVVSSPGSGGSVNYTWEMVGNCGSILGTNSGNGGPATINTLGTVSFAATATLSAASPNFSITQPIMNVTIQ